jgi:uncharacterized membrane protein
MPQLTILPVEYAVVLVGAQDKVAVPAAAMLEHASTTRPAINIQNVPSNNEFNILFIFSHLSFTYCTRRYVFMRVSIEM